MGGSSSETRISISDRLNQKEESMANSSEGRRGRYKSHRHSALFHCNQKGVFPWRALGSEEYRRFNSLGDLGERC